MITTLSQFYFGHSISNGSGGSLGNFTIDFIEPDDGNVEITASLNPGDYTLMEFIAEVERALNESGELTYTVSVDRETRLISISADGNFDLLTNSGSTQGTAVWDLLGFETAADYTGDDNYTADNPSGSVYRPQAVVQDYMGRDDNLEKQDASVNISASGQVQTVIYGDARFFEMNIKPITNLTGLHCNSFEEDSQAVLKARTFLSYAIQKSKMEFMPDRDDPDTFYNVLLESTKSDRDGVGFRLEPLIKDYYETGLLKFREVTV